MNQLQTKQNKQDSIKNPTQQTGQSFGFSKSADHPYLQAQGIIGNHGILRRHNRNIIQAKLKIGQPNDKYEQEADRIADQVMRMPEPSIQRKPTCPECMEEDEEEILRPKHTNNQMPPMTSNIESGINSLKGSGQSLPETTRSFFEPRFGADFSQVRVHRDSEAAETAKSINAMAFTKGKDVVFGSTQYSPETSTGKHLLAHELTHVVQQTKCGKPIIQRQEGAGRTVPRRTAAAARTKAAGALDKAIIRVREAIDNIDNSKPIPEDVRCAFERFFQAESIEFLPLLLKRIERVRGIVETVKTRYVTSPLNESVHSSLCVDLINDNLRKGKNPAISCPQEHYIALFRPFYRKSERQLQATRLIHELFHYYYYKLIIHNSSNPRRKILAYQGFVSQLGDDLPQVNPLKKFPSTCEEESDVD